MTGDALRQWVDTVYRPACNTVLTPIDPEARAFYQDVHTKLLEASACLTVLESKLSNMKLALAASEHRVERKNKIIDQLMIELEHTKSKSPEKNGLL